MKTDTSERQSVESFEICKEIEISAPIKKETQPCDTKS